MKLEEIEAFLNPKNDAEVKFNISAAIEHLKAKTNRNFLNREGVLDLPADLVRAVKILVDSVDDPTNIQSESVGGELSVSYFSGGATTSVEGYWMPYRKVAWNGYHNKR